MEAVLVGRPAGPRAGRRCVGLSPVAASPPAGNRPAPAWPVRSHKWGRARALSGFPPRSWALPSFPQAMWLCKHLNSNLLTAENLRAKEYSSLAEDARRHVQAGQVGGRGELLWGHLIFCRI